MSSVCRFVLDYIEYVSDLAVTNANLSSQELWNMVHASQKYSQLNVLFEKIFSSSATCRACVQQQRTAYTGSLRANDKLNYY